MERTVVHEFDYMVTVSVPPLEASKARRKLNVLHTGQEIFPLSLPTEEIPQPLKDAHNRMHMVHQFVVRVKVWSDGALEMSQ